MCIVGIYNDNLLTFIIAGQQALVLGPGWYQTVVVLRKIFGSHYKHREWEEKRGIFENNSINGISNNKWVTFPLHWI